MSSFSNEVLMNFASLIDGLPKSSDFSQFLYKPEISFIRKSKLGFCETVRFILGAGPTTLTNELRSFFNSSGISICPSAIVQSRAKIKPELFASIFSGLNSLYSCPKLFKGYRLIGVDGSKINIPYNPNDSSFHKGRTKSNGDPGKGYNQLHLSTAYDVLNERILDGIIKDITDYDEPSEMKIMAKRQLIEKAIWTSDRGYESADLIEYLNRNTNFVIRVKDLGTANGLLRGLKLPNGEFDTDVELTFTNLNRREYQGQKDRYKIIQKSQKFEYLDDSTHFYSTKWRIVRFKLEAGYETLITNLGRNEFTVDDLKEIYRLRWGIETSYRYLKTDLNLNCFLSRKKEFIHQEIWAKMTMFNLCSIIRMHLEDQRVNKVKKKHMHKINFSNAIHLIVEAFRHIKRSGLVSPDLDEAIKKKTSPVRKGRNFIRNVSPHSYNSSNYRSY